MDGPGLGDVNSDNLLGDIFSLAAVSAPSLLPLPLKA